MILYKYFPISLYLIPNLPMRYFFTLLLVISSLLAAGQHRTPDGGGEYIIGKTICVSPEQREQIESELAVNYQLLKDQGIIDNLARTRSGSTKFDWPLRKAAGFNYNSYYGISGFVDLNPVYPNFLLDYNCGTRTYDTQDGYNHAGLDIFLWPFDINMMDKNQVEVIAAAPGVILSKQDGNFDKSCSWNNQSWNAVYILHADSTVTWYGHLKKNSLTTKPVGASVAAGEYLGLVGSSGISSGPHLHFEVHNANQIVVEPSSGPCNSSPSMWNIQKPYQESSLNTLMTHYAAPVFQGCPLPHLINDSNNFKGGDEVFFAAYYHDQMAGQLSTYTIYQPDNFIYDTWTHSIPAPHYYASYWYWSYTLPATAMKGNWRFEVDYLGQSFTHYFYVGDLPSGIRQATEETFTIFPNPATGSVSITSADPLRRVEVLSVLGEIVLVEELNAVSAVNLDVSRLSNGIYFFKVQTDSGAYQTKKVILY